MRGGEHIEQPSVLAGYEDHGAKGGYIRGFHQPSCLLADMKFIKMVDERDGQKSRLIHNAHTADFVSSSYNSLDHGTTIGNLAKADTILYLPSFRMEIEF